MITIYKRTWASEICLAIDPNGILLFGCRLQCVTLGEFVQFNPTIPGFVRQIIDRHDAQMDGRRISTKALRIEVPTDVEKLFSLIQDGSRKYPVIVISSGTRENPLASALCDPDYLAEKTIGVAHVVLLSPVMSFKFTDLIGKEFSVFNQAIRTYNPKFNIDSDNPFRHPLAIATTILQWNDIGPSSFTDFLIQQSLKQSFAGDIERELPPFSQIHEIAMREKRERAKKEGASETELLTMALEDIEANKKKYEEDTKTYQAYIRETEVERDQIAIERDQYKSEASALRARIDQLKIAMNEKGSAEKVPIPDTFDGIEDWCRSYLSGSVEVIPRALKEAKRGKYQEPSLAYKALLLLRDTYISMRTTGGKTAVEAYQKGLLELGLEESPSISASRAGEEGEEYKIMWGRQKRLFDRHLKLGSNKDERYCFRLYFFWDEETKQVIVGWLPSHLETRCS